MNLLDPYCAVLVVVEAANSTSYKLELATVVVE